MFKRTTLYSCLATAGLLAGCMSPATNKSTALQIEPLLSIRDARGAAQGKYELGRYYQGQLRLEAASKAYQQALVLDPGLYLAANNLGVIAAGRGDYSEAIRHFLAALAVQPDDAMLHNNLGYALMLQGQDAEALAEFETALRLQPGHARAAANQLRVRQHLALQPDEKRLPPAAGVAQATSVSFEPATVPAPQTLVRQAIGTLEIANGNGVSGMASRLRTLVQEKGDTKARLTNVRPFNQPVSSITYRAGFAASAQALNSRLPNPVPLLESEQLRPGIDVRLLLGKDVVSTDGVAEGAKASWLALLK